MAMALASAAKKCLGAWQSHASKAQNLPPAKRHVLRRRPYAWNIYSIDGNRRTWAGTRSDINHALGEAVDALNRWSPYGAVVEARISYKSGLTHKDEGDNFLNELHRSDLPDIEDLQIDIRPSRQAFYDEQERLRKEYWERRDAARDAGGDVEAIQQQEPEPLSNARVSFRFASWGGWGLFVTVEGPSRDQVEGLHARLMTLLSRRQALKRIDVQWVAWLVPAVSLWAFIFLGLEISHWLHWAKVDNKWEWQEIIMMVVGGLTAIAIGVVVHLLYPRLEVLEEGGRTRAERFGKFSVGSAVAIASGVIAAAIYAHA